MGELFVNPGFDAGHQDLDWNWRTDALMALPDLGERVIDQIEPSLTTARDRTGRRRNELSGWGQEGAPFADIGANELVRVE